MMKLDLKEYIIDWFQGMDWSTNAISKNHVFIPEDEPDEDYTYDEITNISLCNQFFLCLQGEDYPASWNELSQPSNVTEVTCKNCLKIIKARGLEIK